MQLAGVSKSLTRSALPFYALVSWAEARQMDTRVRP